MIEWTYSRVIKSHLLDEVIVATDDKRIFDEVKRFGAQVVMTSSKHSSGTDRIIEVLQNKKDIELVVNIQGDEPGIEIELIEGVIRQKLEHRDWEMSTAACLMKEDEYGDPNRVKVVFSQTGQALYFSRSLIPSNHKSKVPVYRHLGLYCYEKEALLQYSSLPESKLEQSESLEQLRGLDHGYRIGIFVTDNAALSVDSPEDLKLLISDFKQKGLIN